MEAGSPYCSDALRYSHRGGRELELASALARNDCMVLLIARSTRQVKLDYIVASTRERADQADRHQRDDRLGARDSDRRHDLPAHPLAPAR